MRKRLTVALLAAGITAASLLGGGVFSNGRPGPADRFGPVAAQAADARRQPLARLLQGFSTGDTARFVSRLERRVAQHPHDDQSLALLGLAYEQRYRESGDPSYFTLAERALRRARPDDPLVVTGLASLANSRHRFTNGLALAGRALELDPENGSAYGALGDALLNLGRYREAFRAYDRMAVLAPSVASYARVANARQRLGRPRAAIEAYGLALELDTPVPEYVAWTDVQEGNVYFGIGRLDEAEASYRRALRLVPGYVHAKASLARVEAARGRFDTSATMLGEVLDVLPLPEYAIMRGDVLWAAGRRTAATRAYALVDAIEKLFAANGVRTELQTALFDLDHDRNVADALERARAAYRAAPGIDASDVLAWALYRSGNCAEAQQYSRQALRLGTKDALKLFHRGMIEQCLGHRNAAHAFLRLALDTNPYFSLLYAPVAREALAT